MVDVFFTNLLLMGTAIIQMRPSRIGLTEFGDDGFVPGE